ncbi:MAG: flavodoxin [Clostridia bacterium]|nr:flavodoxin [Clostridia bacterium]
MSRIAVVYWSGTGNTEKMANAVAQGAISKGAEVDMFAASQFDTSKLADYDAIAFGCPSMGCEELEDSEFAPMFENCLPLLSGKRIALFGSYGWGDGEWMRNWEKTCSDAGAMMPIEPVTSNEAPDEDGIKSCHDMGAALA